MPKILVVDDDDQLAESLRKLLTNEGFDIDVCGSGEDALIFLESFSFDLILLDWELPKLSGMATCFEYRAKGGLSPVIMLTGRGEVNDKSAALDCGADDYLVKPFHPKELLSRIRAVLRRPTSIVSDVITVGAAQVDLRRGNVVRDGETNQLTKRESALLGFLAKHPQKIFSSKELLDAVWPAEVDASDDSVRTCVKTLRKKLATESETCPLKTIRGYGYVLEL